MSVIQGTCINTPIERSYVARMKYEKFNSKRLLYCINGYDTACCWSQLTSWSLVGNRLTCGKEIGRSFNIDIKVLFPFSSYANS